MARYRTYLSRHLNWQRNMIYHAVLANNNKLAHENSGLITHEAAAHVAAAGILLRFLVFLYILQ
jgi:hypothetical protein